ncbi:MAG: multidrug resistance efflux transporter family protein [Eubacteriales bacterium]|nr:multidrug resistance efflux transporter family protein [Eubacteriales bacterium]
MNHKSEHIESIKNTNLKKAFFYGILASLFFAFTFILNRSMNLSGGYWMWSASLRYIFMLPMLTLIVWKQQGLRPVLKEIQKNPWKWFLWSTVGFGLFYMPLSMASVYGESWFVAATWQITIVAGILLTPLFGTKIPGKNLLWSGIILMGIFILQINHFHHLEIAGMIQAFSLILIAAISYPLGNRKMMLYCPPAFSTVQRVFGMTLCSMPFWLVLSIIATVTRGLPSSGQLCQSFLVALFSGVIATILFFAATNLVRRNQRQLALIEATQAGEVLFTLLGGILFLGDSIPSSSGMIGITVIVVGMIGNSMVTR